MAEAAIAAVGLGASVVSFVGITGQILQGCQFICDYIDDIKDAPKELQQMLLELKIFEAGLRSFQTTLDNAKECVDVNSVEEQICRALNLGNAAIQDLRALVEKHAHNGKRDWWKNFKVAKKKNAFIKYRERLDKAKLEMIFVQLNINTYVVRVSSYARMLTTLG
ncbi:hypothetical protein CJF31_00007754 [Rutstroemia sp. NJR-2017a BVV2]|nr:hypothetical protein CJF31_00005346 [Rutstroemia sp. NJR-2017a BVV2]PQE21896.1 hypothetical protein CJF31_00007754 [Rutstroemia sp. NJR-2017a BVV2]